MKRRMVFMVAAGFGLAVSALGAESYDVTIEHGAAVKMRDGVVLRADVYRPKGEGKFPVLLERTPYDRRGGVDFGLRAAARGYAVIFQDVRGRYASEGEWYTFKHESEDGYDTVEWAAALPYSNGKVGMFGGSYVGATQMLTAIAAPPHLAGVFPVVTASNYHDGWTYQGGAFELWFNSSWTTGLAQDTLNRRVGREQNPVPQWVWKLPLTSYPVLNADMENLAPYYLDWLAHPTYDDYWKRLSIEDQHAKIQVPAYHLGGWYDYVLKGIASGVEREKPVKIFVMGENAWREEDDWPLARAKSTRYYLHSSSSANSLLGDGMLDTEAPQTETPDHFVYNPTEHVPTRGGGLCCDNDRLASGAFDQRPNEARGDVLVFTTPAFHQDFEVTGPVSLELYASSSAVDTDFTGKLVDVWPNGFAQNLTDGILRARYRNSQEKPEFMNPGEVYKFTIDLWATSNVFKAGHKLRLEVSSSNFPRFDRNLNTGEPAGSSTRLVKATNTIYHDRDHPSALILPVIPR